MRIRQLAYTVVSGYFHAALALGFKDHVFRLSTKSDGASQISLGKGDANWFIQETLIKKHDFYRCPSCFWATRKHNEHIHTRGSYCWEDENRHLGIMIEDEIDGKIDRLAEELAYEHELRFG